MPIFLISILFFCLVILGIYGAVSAIRVGKKIFNVPVYLEMPFTAQQGNFALPAMGTYAIWHKGKQFMQAPVDKYKPQIINLDTNKIVPLSTSILRARKSDMNFNASMELFSFRAEAGNYMLQLGEGSSLSDIEKLIPLARLAIGSAFDPDKYFIQVKKYTNPLLIFAFVWLIIGSLISIVFGLVFGINAEQIFGN